MGRGVPANRGPTNRAPSLPDGCGTTRAWMAAAAVSRVIIRPSRDADLFGRRLISVCADAVVRATVVAQKRRFRPMRLTGRGAV